ncbi:MAG: patatin-like phospholipase family protein [Planctomycetes bacterium]|nr:patatin-like phospholipase family protein [Planctomycetota bacterium]
MPDPTPPAPTPPEAPPPRTVPEPPPPLPTTERPPNWWEHAIDQFETWLNRPFARTICWLLVITLFVCLGLLWSRFLPVESTRHVVPGRPVDIGEAQGNPIRFVVMWAEPFLDYLLTYPLFPLVIVFFWLASWAGLGRGLGIQDLIWPESWWQRFWVGVAVSLLFANLLFVRFVLETSSRISTAPNFGDTLTLLPGERDPGVRQLGGFLFWTLIPCLLIFYVPKIASPTYRRILREGNYIPATLIGLLVGVAITVSLFSLDTSYSFSERTILKEPFASFFDRNHVSHHNRELHIRSLVMACIPLAFLLLFAIESRLGGVWSPVWSGCLVIGLLSSVYGALAFYLSGVQIIVVAGILAVAWVCNRSMPYKMSFPALERYHLDPVPHASTDTATTTGNTPLPRVDLDVVPTKPRPPAITATQLLERFAANWQEGQGRGTGTLPKLVLFAVSGGGIRAAVWTAAVLEGLEDEMPGVGSSAAFRDHIRLFTGASGGMLGAALYAADFERKPTEKSPEKLSAMLARDSLWPTMQTMLFSDLPALAIPWAIPWDRGRSLERAWHENTRPYASAADRPGILRRAWLHILWRELGPRSPLEKSFAELHALEAEAKRPSLLFSPMLVEDSRRVLISNLDVSSLTQAVCPSLNYPIPQSPRPEVQSVGAIDLFRYFPEAYPAFQVGTAARMSATFPFVGPGVSLPTEPPRRVVDAGYFDNFGVDLAALWLLENREAVRKYTSGVVLVEVRAYPRRAEKVQFREGDGKGDLMAWGLSEVSTPAEAILNLYARGAYFRNDQLLQLVGRSFDTTEADKADPFFTTVCFECASSATLSWTLPTFEADSIVRGFRNLDGTLHPGVSHEAGRLKAWFGTGGGPRRGST